MIYSFKSVFLIFLFSVSSFISAASTSLPIAASTSLPIAASNAIPSAELEEINKISSNWSNSRKVRELCSAVYAGHLHVARYLLDNLIFDYDREVKEQNSYNWSIYAMAVCHSNQNSMEMVKLLNQYGLDFMPSAFRVLEWSIKRGCFDEIISIFDIVNFEEFIPRIFVPGDFHHAFATKLIDFGLNFDGFVDDVSRNALMFVLDHKKPEIALRLVHQMSDINARDRNGWSALDRCILNPKTLIKVGELIREAGGQYFRLSSAFFEGNVDDVRRCLAAGADPNELYDAGTIIYQFLFARRYDEVVLILQAGADISAPFWGRIKADSEVVQYNCLFRPAYEQALEGNDYAKIMEIIEYIIPKTTVFVLQSYLNRQSCATIKDVQSMIRKYLDQRERIKK